MNVLNYKKLMAQNPTLYETKENHLGQKVSFYEHPTKGEDYPVIAVIEETAVCTDFWDTEDFYLESDYMPILVDGVIMCRFEYE